MSRCWEWGEYKTWSTAWKGKIPSHRYHTGPPHTCHLNFLFRLKAPYAQVPKLVNYDRLVFSKSCWSQTTYMAAKDFKRESSCQQSGSCIAYHNLASEVIEHHSHLFSWLKLSQKPSQVSIPLPNGRNVGKKLWTHLRISLHLSSA